MTGLFRAIAAKGNGFVIGEVTGPGVGRWETFVLIRFHVVRIALLAALAIAGCSPRMHRAYQLTMATAATVAWGCDAMQTNVALAADRAIETNPFNGEHPGPARIWASTAASSALVWAVLAIPANRLSDRLDDYSTGNYVKDALVTLPAVIEALVVRSNADLLHQPAWRCGH